MPYLSTFLCNFFKSFYKLRPRGPAALSLTILFIYQELATSSAFITPINLLRTEESLIDMLRVQQHLLLHLQICQRLDRVLYYNFQECFLRNLAEDFFAFFGVEC